MGRAHVAAVGLGLLALVSIAIANPPEDLIAASGKEADLIPARVVARTAATEESASDADAQSGDEYRKLVEENAALQRALDEARRDFHLLEAETHLRQARNILTRVAEVYVGSPPARQASQLLECWTVIETQSAGGNVVRVRDVLSIEASAHPLLVEFGEVIVNLNEGRLNRYLDVELQLQVFPDQRDQIADLVASHKVQMQDWLLSYLSAQDMEDVRGPENHDRLRNEIRDHFNSLLDPNGESAIDRVYFTKFAIQ